MKIRSLSPYLFHKCAGGTEYCDLKELNCIQGIAFRYAPKQLPMPELGCPNHA